MWLLSFLIFLSPMTSSYALCCSSFLIIIIRPCHLFRLCHYRKPYPILISISKNHSFSFLSQLTLFWWRGRGVWLISFCIPNREIIILTRALNLLILPLYTFSYLTYVFTPFFSLLEFFHQPLLPLCCIQIEFFGSFLHFVTLFFLSKYNLN